MKLTAFSSSSFCAIFSPDNPLIIRIAAFIAVIAFLCIVITMVVIFYNRVSKVKAQKTADDAEVEILEELNEHILLYDSVNQIPVQELNETVMHLNELKNKNEIFRRSMIRLLVYFQTNLSGSFARLFSSAYSRLKLREFTLRKLKSPFWFLKTQGLTEVQRMRDGHSLPEVYILTSDKNQDVRVAAYTVLLKLKAKYCFDFLIMEKEELSEWHQIMLEDGAIKTSGLDIPEFKNYLTSENRSIILLCIKLIVDFKQFNAVPDLVLNLNCDDELIRNQVIQALGELNAASAEERLIEKYETESVLNKASILITLGQISSGEALGFIKDKFLQAEHSLILKSAAAAITAHPESMKKRVIDRLPDLNSEQEAALKHFTEPLKDYGLI